MSERTRNHLSAGIRRQGCLCRAGWWGRLLAAVFFTLYVSYLPLHLVAQPHWHDALPAGHHAAEDAGPHDPAHHGHEDHHAPHPSGEHDLQIRAKSESQDLDIALVAMSVGILRDPPESCIVVPICEHGVFSPQASPDPAQPRAPPAV